MLGDVAVLLPWCPWLSLMLSSFLPELEEDGLLRDVVEEKEGESGASWAQLLPCCSIAVITEALICQDSGEESACNV
eukprot:2679090-Pleurochrysis_carterae.AAC.1